MNNEVMTMMSKLKTVEDKKDPTRVPIYEYYKQKEKQITVSKTEDEKIDINRKVPPIIYLANKAENGFEGEILADFYRKFP